MKRNNATTTAADQQRAVAKRARRERRRAKRLELVNTKLRPLLLRLGQLQAEVESFRKREQLMQTVPTPQQEAGNAEGT